MRTLDFIQIIYEDLQAEQCYSFSRIYKNTKLTPYFENSVIAEIADINNGKDRGQSEYDLIAICSWRLRQKRGDLLQVVKMAEKSLTHEKIVNADFDVAVLTPRSPSHKPLAMASHWHGKAWDDAFKVFKEFLKRDLGVSVPDELKHAVYENHFVATAEIYKDYVNTYLIPSIEFMHRNSDVFLCDAGYEKRKTADERKRYFELTGRKDWPIAPFILERLFSIYCEGRNFKIINL